MDNIALLILCLVLGMVMRANGRLPETAPATLNSVVIHISLPALILHRMHEIGSHDGLLAAALMPWMMFILISAIVILLGLWLGWSRSVIGALILTAGLGNTSFVGLPMIEMFFGAHALPIGILIDQLGSYLVLGTIGILVACAFSGERIGTGEMVRRIATFPPLIALIVALALSPFAYPAWLTGLLDNLGGTLAPLALLSVGAQLRLSQFRIHASHLSYGLGLKLMLAPALVALGLLPLAGGETETWRISVFEAAMGPSIGGGVVAMQYRLSEPVTTLMVGVGIPLSLFTASLWWWVFAPG